MRVNRLIEAAAGTVVAGAGTAYAIFDLTRSTEIQPDTAFGAVVGMAGALAVIDAVLHTANKPRLVPASEVDVAAQIPPPPVSTTQD